MKRRMAVVVSLGLAIFGLAIIFGGCSESPIPSFDNPLDPRNGQGLPVPDSLVVTVGNNEVMVCWGLPGNETADEFVVFRQRIDIVEGEKQVATTTERCYQDTGVQNGRVYAYRIKACRDGRCGPISESIEARPSAFSIVINDDAQKTRNRTVTLELNAPGAESVLLAEDADDLSTPPTTPRLVEPSINYTFKSEENGAKTLFAVFLYTDGSESQPASDSIVLDTQAFILSVDFDGAQTRYGGEILHFRLAAGEPGGTASVTVAGLVTALPLFDNGTSGDPVARDSVYERDWPIPAGITVTSATVTGQFTDDIGNLATPWPGPRTVTVRQAVDPVRIESARLAEPPDAAAVTLRWTQSTATDPEFLDYQIFRSETDSVDTTSPLAGVVTSRTNPQFTDTDVVESHEYFYRVYVRVRSEQQVGSNTIRVFVDNERVPRRVNLQAASSVGATSLTLSWSASTDTDFKAYMVCRNTTGTVTLGDSLSPPIPDVDRNSLQEQGLEPSTTYRYAVFVQDEGGLWSQPSNDIPVTTEGVTLVSAKALAPPAPAAVTLSWTPAPATDFDRYQVFRAEAATVDLTSDRVGEVTARNTLQFTDSTVVEGRTYLYCLYVLTTTGRQIRSLNTLPVEVENLRSPAEVTLEPASAVGAMSLSLRWSRSIDRDFRAYLVCRDTTPTVALSDSVERISNSNKNYLDEFGLVANTTYHYKIFVEDTAGLTSPSNEIDVTTGAASAATTVVSKTSTPIEVKNPD